MVSPEDRRATNLRSLPIPDAAIIAAYAQQYASLANDLSAAESAVAASVRVIARDEAELARLSREGATATREDLSRARQERDEAFIELKASLNGDPQRRQQSLDDLARLSQTIDTVTDRLLTDTERATRLADIRLRLEESRRAHGASVPFAGRCSQPSGR
jgi:chromosome segregation protein